MNTVEWRRHIRGGGTWEDFVPVASFNSPLHRPHYSDSRFASGKTHTLYGRGDARGGQCDLTYVYSDRLWQWDYAKMEEAGKAATDSGAERGSPRWWQEALSRFVGSPVVLEHVIGGVNVSSGYEYYAFGYRDAETTVSPDGESCAARP